MSGLGVLQMCAIQSPNTQETHHKIQEYSKKKNIKLTLADDVDNKLIEAFNNETNDKFKELFSIEFMNKTEAYKVYFNSMSKYAFL